MTTSSTLHDRADTLLRARLHQLRTSCGLPVALSGTTRHTPTGLHLQLTGLSGTLGRGMDGLEVRPGRGIGGTVVAQARPWRVNDYASSTAITHDFDHLVVAQERIQSMFGLPLLHNGTVRGVLYGATRNDLPIGDVAIQRAVRIAADVARELATVLATPPPPSQPTQQGPARALRELAELAESVDDPALRDKLARIHREITGSPSRTRPGLSVAPRERDCLRLVEIGATNDQIAEELGLSVQTVKAYLHSAMRKLDVRNRTSAVHVARRHGLL